MITVNIYVRIQSLLTTTMYEHISLPVKYLESSVAVFANNMTYGCEYSCKYALKMMIKTFFCVLLSLLVCVIYELKVDSHSL